MQGARQGPRQDQLAPKKQANNPYTKGDATAPDWWPKPWGPGKKDKTRHIEPDHMWKNGVYLSLLLSKNSFDREQSVYTS